jgi:hypothetical protein
MRLRLTVRWESHRQIIVASVAAIAAIHVSERDR